MAANSGAGGGCRREVEGVLPLLDQVYEGAVGGDDGPAGAKDFERLGTGEMVTRHEIGGGDHGAAADTGVAVDVDAPAGGTLFFNERDLFLQPLEGGAGGPSGMGDHWWNSAV